MKGTVYLLEVKELKHDYRLPTSRVTQLPKLKRFSMAGVIPRVIVMHTGHEGELWRCLPLSYLEKFSDESSYDLRGTNSYKNIEELFEAFI